MTKNDQDKVASPATTNSTRMNRIGHWRQVAGMFLSGRCRASAKSSLPLRSMRRERGAVSMEVRSFMTPNLSRDRSQLR